MFLHNISVFYSVLPKGGSPDPNQLYLRVNFNIFQNAFKIISVREGDALSFVLRLNLPYNRMRLCRS